MRTKNKGGFTTQSFIALVAIACITVAGLSLRHKNQEDARLIHSLNAQIPNIVKIESMTSDKNIEPQTFTFSFRQSTGKEEMGETTWTRRIAVLSKDGDIIRLSGKDPE